MPTQSLKSLSTADLIKSVVAHLGQDVRLHWRDFKTLSDRTSNEGLSFITKTMPKLAKAMLKGIGTGHFILPSSFKRCRKGSEIPAFCGSLFSKVFHHDGTLKSDACPLAISQIRQVCEFAYKANLPRNVELDHAVISNFKCVEEELARDYDVIPEDSLLVFARSLIKTLFEDFSKAESKGLPFRNGPGVTANCPIDQKFENRLTPNMESVRRYGPSYFFNEVDALTRLDRYPVNTHQSLFRTENCAKVILVPKDSRGPRLISCEPVENQFAQQGIAAYMVSKLESHPLSSGHVNFRDQGINRSLALKHSVDREYSTLDLKDASDRVSMALVDVLFQGTELLTALYAVRSTHTELPDGDRLLLNKHAPMGSALCFPVMATTIYVLLIAGVTGLTGSLQEAIRSVYVYGDDVIITTKYADFAKSILERYGLRVNHDKCFIESYFLESCGMDAFKGVNVTPTRLSECQIENRKSLLKEKPATLLSLVSTANLLKSNYPRAAELLYQFCESWLGPLPFGHQYSPYLCRLAPVEFLDMIPELNVNIKGIRWFRRKNMQRYPLGSVMEAWRVKPVKSKAQKVSIYGHFMRIWGQLGQEDSVLPDLGSFTKPRQYILEKRNFDHYSMYLDSVVLPRT